MRISPIPTLAAACCLAPAAGDAADAVNLARIAPLEGCLAGRLAPAALQKTAPRPDRRRFRAARGWPGAIGLGGRALHDGPADYQGRDDGFALRIGAAGRFDPVTPPDPGGAS